MARQRRNRFDVLTIFGLREKWCQRPPKRLANGEGIKHQCIRHYAREDHQIGGDEFGTH